MLVKTRAIVLHSFKYGDTKLIVDMLTADYGRMSCIAAVGKQGKGKLRRQYFQPLTIIEAVADMRRSTGLQPLKEARVAVPYASIPFDPVKLPVALFTAEFIANATRREQGDQTVFAYAENSLRWLDGCRGGFANFHVVFMMRLTRFLGFYPNTDGYADGCWFDLRAAGFRPDAPLHGDRLPPDEARKVITLSAQFGEGWLLPAEIMSCARQGVRSVISLQPFGCIANHIVSKGVEKKIKSFFPDMNILSLDFDSGVSDVNITNRLLLFIDGLKEKELQADGQ